MPETITRRGFTAGLAVAAAGSVAGAAQADTPYKGITLRFITVRSVHEDALVRRLGALAKQWGITLEVRQTTADDLGKKVVLDFVSGADTWDLIYPGGVQAMYEWNSRGILDDLAPLIARLSDPKILAWQDYTKEARDAATFGKKILGLPAATSDQAVAWRRDLFTDPGEAAAFQAKYHYKLAPPDTYTQWRDIAAFFTRKKGATLAGRVLTEDFYGTVFSDKAGIFVWHIYQNVALAFGVTLYDPKTGKADLLSPAGIAAVKFLLSMVPFMPPGHIGMANPEAMAVFTSGHCAFILEYFDRELGTITRFCAATHGGGQPEGHQARGALRAGDDLHLHAVETQGRCLQNPGSGRLRRFPI
jgi:multiple sugar transport system substrate-binding protein